MGNQEGLVDKASVEGLKVFKTWVDALHTNDQARGEKVGISADSVRGQDAAYAAALVADGDFVKPITRRMMR